MKKKIFIDFALPLSIAIVLTLLAGWMNADLKIEGWFYFSDGSSDGGWFGGRAKLWHFLYQYGNAPGIFLAVAGLLVFVLGFWRKRFLSYRRMGLFFFVFLILGPGLFVNTVLKDNWGRPRPADTLNFGGAETYHQVWERGRQGEGKSFPSGHAAVGFFLMAPFFVLRKTSRPWAMFFLFSGIIYGMLMGAGRMIQGGHYFTDVIWAGVIVYLTGLALYYLFRFDRGTQVMHEHKISKAC